MYFVRPIWRVFSCCAECIAVADILKMPLLPPDWQTLRPVRATCPAYLKQGGTRPAWVIRCRPQTRRATPARVGSVAALRLVSVSKVAELALFLIMVQRYCFFRIYANIFA